MATSRSKIQKKDAQAFRKFLQDRGVTCRDGKGPWQLFQVQAPGATGWKAFCFNSQDVVSGPALFDDMAAVFNAPVEDLPEVVVDASGSGMQCHESDLLDDFAIAALNGMCANDNLLLRFNETGAREMIAPDALLATAAYGVARAMMAARAKHQPK